MMGLVVDDCGTTGDAQRDDDDDVSVGDVGNGGGRKSGRGSFDRA